MASHRTGRLRIFDLQYLMDSILAAPWSASKYILPRSPNSDHDPQGQVHTVTSLSVVHCDAQCGLTEEYCVLLVPWQRKYPPGLTSLKNIAYSCRDRGGAL